MLVSEYKPEFYVMKVQKMRNLRNVYIRGSSVVMSRTDACAERTKTSFCLLQKFAEYLASFDS